MKKACALCRLPDLEEWQYVPRRSRLFAMDSSTNQTCLNRPWSCCKSATEEAWYIQDKQRHLYVPHYKLFSSSGKLELLSSSEPAFPCLFAYHVQHVSSIHAIATYVQSNNRWCCLTMSYAMCAGPVAHLSDVAQHSTHMNTVQSFATHVSRLTQGFAAPVLGTCQ